MTHRTETSDLHKPASASVAGPSTLPGPWQVAGSTLYVLTADGSRNFVTAQVQDGLNQAPVERIAADLARAVNTAQAGQHAALPEDWVPMPRELTDEMMEALGRSGCVPRWEKLLAAAPSLPAASAVRQAPSAQTRVAELESILRSVEQEFEKIARRGDNWPDGFDGRVFRWVKDALAGSAETPQTAVAPRRPSAGFRRWLSDGGVVVDEDAPAEPPMDAPAVS